jgi:hypothetical protein
MKYEDFYCRLGSSHPTPFEDSLCKPGSGALVKDPVCRQKDPELLIAAVYCNV